MLSLWWRHVVRQGIFLLRISTIISSAWFPVYFTNDWHTHRRPVLVLIYWIMLIIITLILCGGKSCVIMRFRIKFKSRERGFGYDRSIYHHGYQSRKHGGMEIVFKNVASEEYVTHAVWGRGLRAICSDKESTWDPYSHGLLSYSFWTFAFVEWSREEWISIAVCIRRTLDNASDCGT